MLTVSVIFRLFLCPTGIPVRFVGNLSVVPKENDGHTVQSKVIYHGGAQNTDPQSMDYPDVLP